MELKQCWPRQTSFSFSQSLIQIIVNWLLCVCSDKTRGLRMNFDRPCNLSLRYGHFCSAALYPLLVHLSVGECPFKRLHHPLCSLFFPLSTFLSVQSFLPRDNWLIQQSITPPPPDPQYPPCLWSWGSFQCHVQFVMISDIMHHVYQIRSQHSEKQWPHDFSCSENITLDLRFIWWNENRRKCLVFT